MPAGIYAHRKLTEAEKKQMGKAWRQFVLMPIKSKRKSARKPKPPPVPRAFPCPTCNVETLELKYCDDCAAYTQCSNCATKHAKVYHSRRPRRWMKKLPPLTGEPI